MLSNEYHHAASHSAVGNILDTASPNKFARTEPFLDFIKKLEDVTDLSTVVDCLPIRNQRNKIRMTENAAAKLRVFA